MICKSAKLQIEIFITIGINFEAEVLNEFDAFILLESQNKTGRSPNKKDRAAGRFKFQNEITSIFVLAALKPTWILKMPVGISRHLRMALGYWKASGEGQFRLFRAGVSKAC